MVTHTYNTRVSLIKAGRVISTKITISLTLIWTALIIASAFLLLNNAGFSVLSEDSSKYDDLQNFAGAQAGKKTADGAFVFVVRNKKMTLTRYTAYIGNNQQKNNTTKPVEVAIATRQNAVAIVRQRKNNNTKEEKNSDFSVKRVPIQ